MSQVITNAFEQYWQSSLAAEQPVVLDEFILADIPNLDITSPIDPATGLPPESQIVHRQNVDQRGRINNNAVAYTIVMDTTVGDFSFNAMYLRNKANGVIGMIVYKGRETKLKTDQTTGQTGNSLVKSMLMGYDQAAEATLTNVDAGTWQIDYAARLRGQDEDLRQLASQLYGHHTFIGDGFKVVQQDGGHQVTQGVAIVGGLRIEMKQPEVIHPGTKPIGVWVDVHRSGSLLSEHQNHFTIITSVADLTDHVDESGYPHYVAKLGTVQADSTVIDGRGQGGSGGSGAIPDTFALWKRSMAEAGYDLIGRFGTKNTIETANQVLLSKDGTEVYAWQGTLPKHIDENTTLENSGDFGDDTWHKLNDALLKEILNEKGGAGELGLDSSLLYSPATVGYRLANSIDITDAPYNARANQTNISEALKLAVSTGRPVYFPEPRNPANYYLVEGYVLANSNVIIHGPRSAKIVFNGVEEGTPHLHCRGKITSIFGLSLESKSRGSIIRAEPKDSAGIDEISVYKTKFKGGFYSVRAGDSVENSLGFPTKKVTIHGAESEAPQGENAGHFFAFGVNRVRYIDCDVKYGRNTSAYGAAKSKDILISGCTEKGVEQTATGVEAAAQIEDCEKCNARIVDCDFEHDIWVASSSGVKSRGNKCRELRVSTDSKYSTFDMTDILFSENTAGRINVQKYGSYDNPQSCSVDFIENTLDPAAHSNMGQPYTSSYIIEGIESGLIRLRGNKNISDATTSAMQITRGASLRLEVDDLSRFGSKPHTISGSGGRILSDVSLEKAVPGQGTTQIADILLGFSPTHTPTAVGNYVNIPFSNIAKNINEEYFSESIVPIEDCVYQFSGIMTVISPSDGVRLAVRILNETDNFSLIVLIDTKLWSGQNTVTVGSHTLKLLAGKVYRLQYVTGNSACQIVSGLSNTGLAIKALI
ncbi:phage tail protein [Aeromonas hydrophila]|uniref:phage tail-collar fiber domain-containing protein n=1 Tax=Aeromonas hydrophila TaxID=644 RepID=UPI0030DC14F0